MKLLLELADFLPAERIHARSLDRYAYARDASFYRLIPKVVVEPISEQEVATLFHLSRQHGVPLVFRAAGTSLSGQAITDGILALIGRHWRGYRIADSGEQVTLQPGIIGAHANRYLQEFERKIGPDPASIQACYIGGIVANNASGMCCGVEHNAYHTLDSARFILPNGLIFDTSRSDADDELKAAAPDLHEGLLALRQRLLDDDALTTRIRDKYQRKNTMGYSLNALLDYEQPLEMLAHLLVGSEGTLGFISEVTLRTLPDPRCKATALLLFENLQTAVEAVSELKRTGAAALEIMDRASLRAVEDQPGMPTELAGLPPAGAALLAECQASDEETLTAQVAAATEALAKLDLAAPVAFTREQSQQARLWKIRKGLFPAVGAVRKSGTTVIIEDVCFRSEDLAAAILELQALFKKHRYHNAIIFGHAKDGNLHFVITQAFDNDEAIARYDAFMRDVVEMTAGRFDGSLKAEHGTGRNMAPFLETEWGPEAVAIMRELKRLIDPDGLLNPGVILNDDPRCHLQDLKPLTPVHGLVDTCIECGFCEPVCPSRDYTLTPRRRIAAAREIALLQAGHGHDQRLAAEIQQEARFDSLDTCATDGLCALGCPVAIDTGKLVKHLREQLHSPMQARLAKLTLNHFGWTVGAARTGLRIGHALAGLVGNDRMTAWSTALHTRSGRLLPIWHAWIPEAAASLPPPRQRAEANREEIVYFPACLTRGLGKLPKERQALSPTEAFMDILRAANIHASYPEGINNLCCGQPYSSKGLRQQAIAMATRLTNALYDASKGGKLPIVIDTSPCSHRIKTYDELLTGQALKQWQRLKILDIIEFLHDTILERVMPEEVPLPAILHPVCSVTKMGLQGKFQSLAEACCIRAIIPDTAGCCGFAGDRGFSIPELTAAATREESQSVRELPPNARHYSTCRTCEIGMSQATGRPYSSIIYLVHEAVCQPERHEL